MQCGKLCNTIITESMGQAVVWLSRLLSQSSLPLKCHTEQGACPLPAWVSCFYQIRVGLLHSVNPCATDGWCKAAKLFCSLYKHKALGTTNVCSRCRALVFLPFYPLQAQHGCLQGNRRMLRACLGFFLLQGQERPAHWPCVGLRVLPCQCGAEGLRGQGVMLPDF